jgi:hypothetical protein
MSKDAVDSHIVGNMVLYTDKSKIVKSSRYGHAGAEGER